MTARLKNVVSFDFVNFLLHDPAGDVVRLNVWEGSPGPQLPIELPTRDTVTGWVMEHQQPMLCDTEQEARFAPVMAILREHSIRSYCVLPLTSGEHRIGALGFGRLVPSAYDGEDLDFLQNVAHLVALAIENSVTRQALTKDRERFEAMLEVSEALAAQKDLPQLVPRMSASIGRV